MIKGCSSTHNSCGAERLRGGGGRGVNTSHAVSCPPTSESTWRCSSSTTLSEVCRRTLSSPSIICQAVFRVPCSVFRWRPNYSFEVTEAVAVASLGAPPPCLDLLMSLCFSSSLFRDHYVGIIAHSCSAPHLPPPPQKKLVETSFIINVSLNKTGISGRAVIKAGGC